MRKPQEVKLSQHEREELERWTRNPTLSERQRWRAHMLLLAHEGKDDTAIAGELSRSRQWCRNIRGRFLAEGLQALAKDRPRRGRPKQIDDQRVITLTKDTPPPPAMVWTRARMAKKAGVSASSVGRIWRQNGIHWHQFTPLKLSGDPRFSEKLEAVVGFCLAPPILALVLCVDRNTPSPAAGAAARHHYTVCRARNPRCHDPEHRSIMASPSRAFALPATDCHADPSR